MKKTGMGLCGLLFLSAWAQAGSLGVLYQDRTALLLAERVGKPENLADNPAYLLFVPALTLDTYTAWQSTQSQPADPVYSFDRKSETLFNAFQAVCPLGQGLAANLGEAYQQALQFSGSTSQQDGSFLHDSNKEFSRKVNVALAKELWPGVNLGYAFQQEKSENYSELFSDFTDSYEYASVFAWERHTLGLVDQKFEAAASWETSGLLGSQAGLTEADLAFTSAQLMLGYFWGEFQQANLWSRVFYSSSFMQQRQFLAAHSAYNLKAPDWSLEINAVLDYPLADSELAAGIIGRYGVGQIFDLDTYAWTAYQDIQCQLPIMVKQRVFGFLQLWLELDIVVEKNTAQQALTCSLQPKTGMSLTWAGIEFKFYVLPQFTRTAADTMGKSQNANLALDINWQWPTLSKIR